MVECYRCQQKIDIAKDGSAEVKVKDKNHSAEFFVCGNCSNYAESRIQYDDYVKQLNAENALINWKNRPGIQAFTGSYKTPQQLLEDFLLNLKKNQAVFKDVVIGMDDAVEAIKCVKVMLGEAP